MSKAFTKETDSADDDEVVLPALPAGGKNYITPAGYARLRDELLGNGRQFLCKINHLQAAWKLRTKGSWVRFLPAAPMFKACN